MIATEWNVFCCKSGLVLQVDLGQRTVDVEFNHRLHAPYVDTSLSPEINDFIQERLLEQTPSELNSQIRQKKIKGWDTMTETQIYYQWQKANVKQWRCNPDPVVSSYTLLGNMEQSYNRQIFTFENVSGLAIYITSTIHKLPKITMEMAMDETYGTNSAGMGLFAVLAEVDGSGVPVAYLLVEVKENANGKKKAGPGAMIQLIQNFLRPLKNSGFSPAFFGCDKDNAEIAAIKFEFPTAKIQLCFWHAKRAIQKRLLSSNKSLTQEHYFPELACAVIPELDVCWGSILTRRPDEMHRREKCSCPSKGRERGYGTADRLELRTPEEREVVIKMFARHYNRHAAFPDAVGCYKDSEAIHAECCRELYAWCYQRNYFRLWAYFWINWYCPDQWKLWARAAANDLSVLRTTMIVESHWRKIKHDYLHRFNRPRIDLVTWILCTRVIPDSVHWLYVLSNPSPAQKRLALSSWRKDWKRDWDRLEKEAVAVSSDKLQLHHTDPRRFVCSCKSFLTSRFLVCRHLVHCFEPVPQKRKAALKRNIQRHRQAPFWRSPDLRIRDKYRSWFPQDGSDNSEAVSDNPFGTPPSELLESEDSVAELTFLEEDSDSGAGDDELDEIKECFFRSWEIFSSKLQEGNTKFVNSFVRTHRLEKMKTFVEEVDRLKGRRTFAKTWDPYKHPSMIFFNK